jgi:hypothetical protein
MAKVRETETKLADLLLRNHCSRVRSPQQSSQAARVSADRPFGLRARPTGKETLHTRRQCRTHAMLASVCRRRRWGRRLAHLTRGRDLGEGPPNRTAPIQLAVFLSYSHTHCVSLALAWLINSAPPPLPPSQQESYQTRQYSLAPPFIGEPKN